MIVIGLDPGYRQSAYVEFDGARIHAHAIVDNDAFFTYLDDHREVQPQHVLVIEEMQMFSQHGVGKEVFDSVFWSGRFAERWSPHRWEMLIRAKVRSHLCGTMRSGDPQVKAALVARFGPYREDAIGSKKKQGPLYGITSHEWSALALAVTWWDLHVDEILTTGLRPEFAEEVRHDGR